MNERYLKRLMGSLDPLKPSKESLWKILLTEFLILNPPDADVKRLRETFNISYYGHLYTPARKSGEAYIFHILRCTIREIWRQRRHGIYSLYTILTLLLHDCFEDAAESRRNRRILEGRVTRRLGAKQTYGVLTLTKHKERGETDPQYFLRMLQTEIWEVLCAKFEDRLDNIYTIQSMPYEKMVNKIRETECWFPLLRERLRELLIHEVEAGRLPVGILELPDALWRHLRRVMTLQKRRLGVT